MGCGCSTSASAMESTTTGRRYRGSNSTGTRNENSLSEPSSDGSYCAERPGFIKVRTLAIVFRSKLLNGINEDPDQFKEGAEAEDFNTLDDTKKVKVERFIDNHIAHVLAEDLVPYIVNDKEPVASGQVTPTDEAAPTTAGDPNSVAETSGPTTPARSQPQVTTVTIIADDPAVDSALVGKSTLSRVISVAKLSASLKETSDVEALPATVRPFLLPGALEGLPKEEPRAERSPQCSTTEMPQSSNSVASPRSDAYREKAPSVSADSLWTVISQRGSQLNSPTGVFSPLSATNDDSTDREASRGTDRSFSATGIIPPNPGESLKSRSSSQNSSLVKNMSSSFGSSRRGIQLSLTDIALARHEAVSERASKVSSKQAPQLTPRWILFGEAHEVW